MGENQHVKDLEEELGSLKQQRGKLDTLCAQLSRYYLPWRGRFAGDDDRPDQLHGDRMEDLIESTSVEALIVAQNGIHSGITPSSRPWLKPGFEDPGLDKYGPAKLWKDQLEQAIYSVFRRSNFYSTIHATYAEILLFGTGAFQRLRDENHKLLFRHFTFGEYWIATDHIGRVNTFMRQGRMTVQQIVNAFGKDRVSSMVLRDFENRRFHATYTVMHAVKPRLNADLSKIDYRNMPFESTYWERDSGHALGEKMVGEPLRVHGYKTLPYFVGRWETVGADAWGTAQPALMAWKDVLLLQDQEETSIIATHKQADPPVTADTSLKGFPIRRGAGEITYVNSSIQQKQLEPLYGVNFDIRSLEHKQDQLRTRIGQAFFKELFLMISALENKAQPVTAAQIYEMSGEKMLQLGPFTERLCDEVLDPAVNAVIDSILEFPEMHGVSRPPQEVLRNGIKIEYIGFLALAQRSVGLRAIDETMTAAGNWAAAFPDILDNVDSDEAFRLRANQAGAPASMIRSEEQVQATRQKRREDMAKQEQAAQMQQMIQGANVMGNTPMNPQAPNALTEFMKAVQPAGSV